MRSHDPLESILGRIEDLDEVSLNNLVSRLARERKLLNTLFNALKEGILVVDAEGIILYANGPAGDLAGIKPRNLGKLSLWKAVPDLARSLNLTAAGRLSEVGGISREVELTYPERRVVRIYIVPFEEEVDDEKLARFAVILSDITREKTKTRKEIEDERVRSIIQLAAGVAHELGNPLNSITIHLQLLSRQLSRLPEEVSARMERSLDICSKEVARLDNIISHFLEAVRPRDPDLRELGLIAVLEESLSVLEPEMEDAGITIDIEIASKTPVVLGDRDQVKQVFFNLLKNARQAMGKGGVIKVRVFSDDDEVYVQFGDTGKGIAEEDLPRVFQPYFTTRKGGHGLGMMICERIMRAHGGRIGIDSRRGVGTVVTLEFPQKHRRVRLLEASDD
ncbi:MAG: PAS domain S-box protein [Opitutales bacterium]|nr:PAS domain S-box protein [Opitutales bacterium]